MDPIDSSPRAARATDVSLQDEHLAIQYPAKLLITAREAGEAERCARRIHSLGPRASLPYVTARSRDLPSDPGSLRDFCSRLLDAAAGGTLFLDDVEEMPGAAQTMFLEMLAALELERDPIASVRLISGTRVSLLARIADGSFDEQLFYRLNLIHLIAVDEGPPHDPGGSRH